MAQKRLHPPRTFFGGLSFKLLVLTTGFVMLAEVFIYAPSIARYRQTYLTQALSNAHLATLALEASPDDMIGPKLQAALLDHAGAQLIVRRAPGESKRMLMGRSPARIDATFDLRGADFFGLIASAFKTMFSDGNRILRILGPSPKDPNVLIEVVIPEAPLRQAMINYSWRILGLSLIISLFTAALVFIALRWLLVRPLRRLTENMIAFREAPEDASRLLRPGRRTDEVGVAERELRNMQEGLRRSLRQRARLAALGAAVTKINHDLRNMLASAQLVSDRLAARDDPDIKRIVPPLVRSIDRAVELCGQTLDYARQDSLTVRPEEFSLAELVDEVFASQPGAGPELALKNWVQDDIQVRADRGQLYRVLSNLVRNAVQAGAGQVTVDATDNSPLRIVVVDNGPGIPPEVRPRLFEAFSTSGRTGGSGLGLAIAREIVIAHQGKLSLEDSAAGAHFVIELPRG